jgi:GntR family transcriptional regulator, rspAB operon transcriptional repressor
MKTMLKPRRLLAHEAYDTLKSALQKGDFEGGAVLSEREIARRLRMSETPVKAALARLQEEGFVTITPRHGIVVRALSWDEIDEIFELREALEGWVLRKLARKGLDPDQDRSLEKNLRALEAAARLRDLEASTRLDTEFHIMLGAFTGNGRVARTLSQLREQLHRIIRGRLSINDSRLLPSALEHRAIVEALRARDGDLAVRRLDEHFRNGREALNR